MRRIVKFIVITMLLFGTTSTVAQNNITSNHNDFYKEIIKDMPSLDFLGEYKFQPFENVTSTFKTIKRNAVANNDNFHKEILKDMPSLDFFGDYKHSIYKNGVIEFKTPQITIKDVEDTDTYIEMPSIDF
ncbi:hypothetical protein MHTCC0001_34840 [Flavobacteriaceae bacterium MHTCC 0001]